MMRRGYARAFPLRRCQYGLVPPSAHDQALRHQSVGSRCSVAASGTRLATLILMPKFVVFDTGFGVSPAVLALSDHNSPSTSQRPPPRTGF